MIYSVFIFIEIQNLKIKLSLMMGYEFIKFPIPYSDEIISLTFDYGFNIL